jgi:uncharacterized membrane protein
MSTTMRLARNLFSGWFIMRQRFPAAVLQEIASTVAAGERRHRGEIRVAIEARLAPGDVLAGVTPHQRAEQLFAHLRVWNTEHNNGVLLYVLLAEHAIEIVADRGIAAHVGTDEWTAICESMRTRFAGGQWREGMLDGVQSANALLARHYPGDGGTHVSELPDEPIIL